MNHWIASSVIYQINLRAIASREPRNPFEAAREKAETLSPLAFVAKSLAMIKKLGANVLYFLPPYPIGNAFRKGLGSPYSIRDFQAIDPEYGTLEEMQALVRRAHEMKFKVIFDITPNHTSRDNVWTTSNPEFYVKRYNGEVFYDCDWSDTAKLDYRQPALRAAMIDIYDFWLGFLGGGDGIDGFRLDMAHFINDKSFWNEAMPELKKRHASRELLFLAECYGGENNLDLFARGINAAYDDDFYKVAQYFYGVDENENSLVIPDPGVANNDGFRDRYNAFLEGGLAGAFECALTNYEKVLPAREGPWLARYTDNHDEGRGLYLWGAGAVRAINTLAFLSGHCLPFIFTGQEFGAVNRPSIHGRFYPIGKARRVREGDRKYEQASVETETNTFARTAAERSAWFEFYRELIQLRLKQPALQRGSFELIDVGEDAPRNQRTVVAFERKRGRSRLRCAVNMGDRPRKLSCADTFAGAVAHGSLNDCVLPSFSAIVVRAGR
jgi:glycosidase